MKARGVCVFLENEMCEIRAAQGRVREEEKYMVSLFDMLSAQICRSSRGSRDGAYDGVDRDGSATASQTNSLTLQSTATIAIASFRRLKS